MARKYVAPTSGTPVAAVLAVLISATAALAAPPSLFYSLLPLNRSQSSCLQRAYASVASEVAGRIERRTDNVSLVNDDFNIGVHCRSTGSGKSFATIVVAHRTRFDEARGVALNIRRAMETGIIE